jgi:hypothetical protein
MTVLQTFKTTQEITMNHGTKTLQLPELRANILREEGCLVWRRGFGCEYR